MSVEITHPEKVLFPHDGVTKADLASYYGRVSEWMLPHIRNRPLSLQRFPAGIEVRGFFHKDVPDYFPAFVRRMELEKREGGTITHALANDARTLEYLVGQNTITPHVWLSRADRPDQPDRLVFDLDPPGKDFASVRRAARWTGELLREIDLVPFAQVTGSKGIHVWTPLRRRDGFDDVKDFARVAAAVLASRHPDELTTEFRKAKREGRILIDVFRNGYAQTAVPPYAVRARPGAPVATPLEWDELSDSKLRPDRWTVKTLLRRLDAKGDPWAEMQSHARGLSQPRRRLKALS